MLAFFSNCAGRTEPSLHPAACASQVASHGLRQRVSRRSAGACLPQGRSPLIVFPCSCLRFEGSHRAASFTARSLRAPFFERAGVQLDASLHATRLILFCFFVATHFLILLFEISRKKWTNITAEIALRHRGFLQARSPLRSQTSVSRRHRMFSYPRAFSRPPLPTLMGRSLVSCPLRLRIDGALPRLTMKTMGIGVAHGARTSHVPLLATLVMPE